MHVVSLLDGRPCDPAGILAGPWRWLRLIRLPAGAREALAGEGAEHALFVVEGAGTATVDGRDVPLAAGSALVVLRGGSVELIAGDDGLLIFGEAIGA